MLLQIFPYFWHIELYCSLDRQLLHVWSVNMKYKFSPHKSWQIYCQTESTTTEIGLQNALSNHHLILFSAVTEAYHRQNFPTLHNKSELCGHNKVTLITEGRRQRLFPNVWSEDSSPVHMLYKIYQHKPTLTINKCSLLLHKEKAA